MGLSLNAQEQALLDLLLTIPPRYNEAERHICKTGMTAESVTKVAIQYAEECFGDGSDYLTESLDESADIRQTKMPQDGFPELHSSYIVNVVQFLLEYGLEPNAVFQEEQENHNIMSSITFIDNGYLGVDALALLLKHGGDPNLCIGGETLPQGTAFDIWFGSVEQECRWRYDIWVHRWLVLTAFGGKDHEDSSWPKVFKVYDENGHYGTLFDIRNLREHRNFCFGLSFEDGERTLHIFDKNTFWKVAEWR